MLTTQEIRDIIAETAVAGLGDMVEEAVRRWSGSSEVTVDMYGKIWMDGDWLNDEKVLEFWAWNEAN